MKKLKSKSEYEKEIFKLKEENKGLRMVFKTHEGVVDMWIKKLKKRNGENKDLKEVLLDKKRVIAQMDKVIFGKNAAKSPAGIDVLLSLRTLKSHAESMNIALDDVVHNRINCYGKAKRVRENYKNFIE